MKRLFLALLIGSALCLQNLPAQEDVVQDTGSEFRVLKVLAAADGACEVVEPFTGERTILFWVNGYRFKTGAAVVRTRMHSGVYTLMNDRACIGNYRPAGND